MGNDYRNECDYPTDINAFREYGVTQEFRENIGMRALILIAPFPFLIIGRIEDVVTDYLIICAEVTNINELDGEEFRIHIDDIEVFYIEKDNRRPIPDIRNGFHA
ncbi:hypothetical protein [Ureibacillus aquaedulcis]|uniref:Uncharacterized protein n=1 Tax=Ureibacillus aquaedulcis TaxID=3058421 RepID=A0ABT8GNC9_9BACL|nr:hypothetical protein [Ureibacillus sp. BA0131]MDN4492796.1 hypothetical protein [Ureibacillus sp. BA0131]